MAETDFEPMHREPTWLEKRITPFVERKHIAPLRDGTSFICWYEYDGKKEPQRLLISNTFTAESICTGDVIVWQPELDFYPSNGKATQASQARGSRAPTSPSSLLRSTRTAPSHSPSRAVRSMPTVSSWLRGPSTSKRCSGRAWRRVNLPDTSFGGLHCRAAFHLRCGGGGPGVLGRG